jgi:4-hydroxyphenylpyruvate dioxygenase-like putative hemolysin
MSIEHHTQAAKEVLKNYKASGEQNLAFATGPLVQAVKHLLDGLEEANTEIEKLKSVKQDKASQGQGN